MKLATSEVAVIAWHAPSRVWVFDHGPAVTVGDDPVAAVAAAFADDGAERANLLGTVNRRAFDRRHVFVIAFVDGMWSCCEFADADAIEGEPLRRQDRATPIEAIMAVFEELGGLRIVRAN